MSEGSTFTRLNDKAPEETAESRRVPQEGEQTKPERHKHLAQSSIFIRVRLSSEEEEEFLD